VQLWLELGAPVSAVDCSERPPADPNLASRATADGEKSYGDSRFFELSYGYLTVPKSRSAETQEKRPAGFLTLG
jgi:hypothetical protein